VTIERAFVGRNPQSALALGLARGVAMVCAARAGAEVAEVTPGEAKRAVAAGGGAAKDRVQRMVQLLLGLATPPAPDAADAAALALCGAGRL
jgi:crossover junction endodeoxyribonuclease RuvC